MASLPLARSSDPLPSPSPSAANPRRRSTAQMRLDKILAIIATCPPRDLPSPSADRRSGVSGSSRADGVPRSFARIEIDLNLRLGPLPEDPAGEGGLSACSAVGKSEGCPESGEVTTLERSSEVECDLKPDITNENAAAAGAAAATRIESSSGSEQAEGRGDGGSKSVPNAPRTVEGSGRGRAGGRDEGHLNLLVEAARHVSGGFNDDVDVPQPNKSPERNQPPPQEESEAAQCCRSKSKPCCCWMVDYYGDFEETAPVVRSKRGRNQMLPSRFRDSVMEPLRRLARHR